MPVRFLEGDSSGKGSCCVSERPQVSSSQTGREFLARNSRGHIFRSACWCLQKNPNQACDSNDHPLKSRDGVQSSAPPRLSAREFARGPTSCASTSRRTT